KRVFLSPLWMPEERGITSDNSGKEYRMRQHFKHIVIRHKPVPIVYVLESPELFDESDDDFLLSV
ncbi:hypothetical protein, partial [Gelidibacter salicanalis]|uniref:hypothetical protein n=1 Tax=Gelidibacter salicanalis TaxID=291193 RepID=UPI001F277CC4